MTLQQAFVISEAIFMNETISLPSLYQRLLAPLNLGPTAPDAPGARALKLSLSCTYISWRLFSLYLDSHLQYDILHTGYAF